MRNEGVEKVERYSSGGLAIGVVGLVLTVGAIVYGAVDRESGFAPWGFALLGLVAVLIWAVMIRPAVRLHGDVVELRNILRTHWVPYGRITSVQVAQVTVVQTDEAKYVGSGFGRSRRIQARDQRLPDGAAHERHSMGWLIEDKLRRRAAESKERGAEQAPVRQAWAWPEIVALAVLALATVVLAFVG
ncbi:hypothetical protein ACFJIY_19405 [Pimelobacter simplex]|uniref:hypothetical protein n=1 Tax=Nocardioides simplex TaxID=2045 RepID=UPI00366F323D